MSNYLINRIYSDVNETFYKDPLVMVMDTTWMELAQAVKESATFYHPVIQEARETIRIGGIECEHLGVIGHGYIIGEREDMAQLRDDLTMASHVRIGKFLKDAWQRAKEAHVNYVDTPKPLIMHHVTHGRDGGVMHGFVVQCDAW